MLQKLVKATGAAGLGSSSRPTAGLSVIGPDVRIVGDIITKGEMQIDGEVEGDIACQTLVVGEGARIAGAVTAETVRVHGELNGRIEAETVVIARSARVVGDVTHTSLEIEAGAQLEGHIARKAGAAKPAPAPVADKKVNGAAHPHHPASRSAIEAAP
ncbi:MAG TPA: polymer-forming cytoskeletal protein, partial [Candidatus Omnitrophota bacterium]|nr:polymer-forming cytoskeletal protein [Candidatus Omnitrophota bacterium]